MTLGLSLCHGLDLLVKHRAESEHLARLYVWDRSNIGIRGIALIDRVTADLIHMIRLNPHSRSRISDYLQPSGTTIEMSMLLLERVNSSKA